MRIIAGRLRGRKFTAPAGEGTRPTSDRVRESLFSSLSSLLGPDLGGGTVLDAFAGSGALGLEALSRGCSRAVLVEADRRALQTLRANVDTLGLEADARIVAGDTFSLAKSGSLPHGPFALILLDPPYRLPSTEIVAIVSALGGHDLLEDGAAIVFEHATRVDVEWPDEFELHTRKRYGTTEIDIVVYERGDGST